MTGHRTNTIVNTEAKLPDGSVAAYRDTDPSHIKRAVFHGIMEAQPLEFAVTVADGSRFAVDLTDGSLLTPAGRFLPEFVPPTPLLAIYYKRMSASVNNGGGAPHMDYFCVGWQSTYEGRNVRAGLKVFADRFELTPDI